MINPRLLITETIAQSYMRRLDLWVPRDLDLYPTPVFITGAESQDAQGDR